MGPLYQISAVHTLLDVNYRAMRKASYLGEMGSNDV